jgi:hypothetical protein
MHSFNLTLIDQLPQFDLDMDAKLAILDGLANSNTTRSNIAPSCISGNCSFPLYNGVTHSSIGMCRKCVNITPWVVEVRNNTTNSYIAYGGNGVVLPYGTGVAGALPPIMSV